MRKSIILLPLLLISLTLWGQSGDRVQAMKVAYITNRVGFTPEESEKFWPLYNQFEKNEKALRNQYKFTGNLMTVSDAEAEQFMRDNFEMEARLLELKKQFFQDLLKIMPAKKIMMVRRAEKEFNVELLKTLKERRRNNRFNKN